VSAKTKWLRVARQETIPIREGRSVFVEGRQIALFNLGDRFLATENRCPHQGGPLSDGIVTGNLVVCPLHSWKINLETGEAKNSASPVPCVKTYATRVEDGIVYLEFPFTDPKEEIVPTPSVHRDRPVRWVRRKEGPNPQEASCAP
jgi:nitrite reductase (NADH) small subunit